MECCPHADDMGPQGTTPCCVHLPLGIAPAASGPNQAADSSSWLFERVIPKAVRHECLAPGREELWKYVAGRTTYDLKTGKVLSKDTDVHSMTEVLLTRKLPVKHPVDIRIVLHLRAKPTQE